MNIDSVFPSKYLKCSDLQDRNVRVVMDRVEKEQIGDDEKPILYFQGKTKGLVLNKTNANNIALVYGSETDEWIGKELILYPAMVDFQGRSVPAIRVRPPTKKDGAGRKTLPPQQVVNAREPSVDQDEPIPF